MSIDLVRATIVSALEDADALGHLKPAQLTAFEAGREDIGLLDLGLDSITRMDLLVALELEHDAVISPHEYAQLESLEAIAAHVHGAEGGDEAGGAPEAAPAAELPPREPAPDVVRLFQRTFPSCGTVAQLNKALAGFENRLTPITFKALADWHRRGALFPPQTPAKFVTAMDEWLAVIERFASGSGKARPEPFEVHRISPAARLFTGPGDRAGKTLLVCYATLGTRQIWMAHAVLLQYVDAQKYDVLVLSDPWGTGFRAGVPQMGRNVRDVVEWVATRPFVSEYGAVRTMGCSGGGYPAMLTGRRLDAELALCLCGRFPSERHFIDVGGMLLRSWAAARRNPGARVLMVHGVTKRRDIAFARRLAKLTGGNRLAVEIPSRRVDHNIVQPMLDLGELAGFFDRTLFAPVDADVLDGRGKNATLRIPANA